MSKKVAVVGGGIIGLSTAETLLEDHTNIEVTVFSDKLTPNTTADVSAGILYPYLVGNNPITDVIQWWKMTEAHLISLSKEGGHISTGICAQSAYFVWKTKPCPMDLILLRQMAGFREVMKEELRNLTNEEYAGGCFVTTWTCSCGIYLPYLVKKLKSKGVKFVKEKISSLDNLADRGYDVVVNCTGYGAKELTGDDLLKPLKGQVLRVNAPWMRHGFLELDGDFYVIPVIDSVLVGGTHNEESSLEVDKEVNAKIWETACMTFPSLKNAKVLEHAAGLRPGRSVIRMEVEHAQSRNGKNYLLLHHYGHGGSGVTLHKGSAKHVSSLLYTYMRRKVQANL